MSAIQIVCAVAVPLLWGYQFVAIKVGVIEFPPLFFLALRFLAIAVLLIPFVKTPTRQQLGPIAAISVFLGGLNFGLFYVGLGLGSGSMSAVAYQLATPFTVLLAWPLLAERPSLTTSAGVVLAFVGVLVLAAGPGLSPNALPLLLVVGAAFAFAVSNVLTKRYGPFDPMMLVGWSSLLTVPQVMLMSLLLEYGQLASLVTANDRGWLALAYTVFIGGIVGFGLWFWLIARCSMGRVAPFGLLLPVFAVISSVLFLGDRITPKLIVGGLLAISGVAITQVRPSARPTEPGSRAVAASHPNTAARKSNNRHSAGVAGAARRPPIAPPMSQVKNHCGDGGGGDDGTEQVNPCRRSASARVVRSLRRGSGRISFTPRARYNSGA